MNVPNYGLHDTSAFSTALTKNADGTVTASVEQYPEVNATAAHQEDAIEGCRQALQQFITGGFQHNR